VSAYFYGSEFDIGYSDFLPPKNIPPYLSTPLLTLRRVGSTCLRSGSGCITFYYMRETVTVSLPEEIKNELDRVVKEEGVSRSDVVRESLRDYLFIRQFRRLRAKMSTKARKQGIFTDQDVFDRVS